MGGEGRRREEKDLCRNSGAGAHDIGPHARRGAVSDGGADANLVAHLKWHMEGRVGVSVGVRQRARVLANAMVMEE